MISIIIPTINRYDLLIKGLKFLNYQNFKGQVIIADSSDIENFNNTKSFLNNNKHSFYFEHVNCGKKPVFECIKKVLYLINENFCIWLPDDDFIIIKNLKKNCNILNQNQDISAVGGMVLLADTNNNKIRYFDKYTIKSFDIERSDERFFYHINNYSVIQYSIQRSQEFVKRFTNIPLNIPSAFGNEFLPCFFLAISGKVIMKNNLLFVRNIHERRVLLEKDLGKIEEWSKFSEKILNSILKYKKNYLNSDQITKENLENAILNLLNNKKKKLGILTKKINSLKSKLFYVKHFLINYKEVNYIKNLLKNFS